MKLLDKENYARIHSIETLGTVDGPGLRFVVFFQGCHLNCKYCHNRDTWDCSKGTVVSANEIFNKVLRYKNFLIPSGGGFTATGGEPLLQIPYLITLFQKFKNANIHTAIDTSGMFDLTDSLKKLLSLTDLVLLDIKHIKPEKCHDLVGFTNEKELAFAKYLSDNNIPMWIRQVIIPGITDDKEDLLLLKQFISSLNTVQKIELLPYHNLGIYKWEKLNLEYKLKDVANATEEDVTRAKKILGI